MPAVAELAPLQVDQPYPGLRSFEPHEAHLFHGREPHTRELLMRLTGERFIAVVGTSGSGKSSLVRAGLIPALRGGFLPGATSEWRVAMMKPGDAPLDRLAEALREAGIQTGDLRGALGSSDLGLVQAVREGGLRPGENLLLVADQFEEIFRFTRTRGAEDRGAEASQFVASLLEAAGVFTPPIYVVLTMRSDFLGECTRFTGLPEALNRGQYLVPRLTREQLREAIVNPLMLARAPIDPRLVERLLNEAGNEPDQLPVLQHALNRTFEIWKGSGGPLAFEHYEKAGTMDHALGRHAEALMEGLPAALVERVFRCLTVMEGGRAVRRPLRLGRIGQIVGAAPGAIREIVDRFAAPRDSLLVRSAGDDPVIDISHERLIPLWKRLSGWVESEARCVDLYCRATADARRYPAEASLWRGPELKAALGCLREGPWSAEWAAGLPEPGRASFSPVEEFVLAGEREEKRLQAEAEAQVRREADVAKALAEAAEMRAAEAAKAQETEAEARAQAEKRAEAESRAAEKERLLAEAESRARQEAVHRAAVETEARQQAEKRAEAEARTAELEKQRAASEQSRKRQILLAGVLVAIALALAGYSQYSVAARLEAERKRLTDAFLAEAREKQQLSETSERILKIQLEERDLRGRPETAETRSKLKQLAEEREQLERQRTVLAASAIAARMLINPVDNQTYVWIPPGRFRMGCSPGDSECIGHEVPAHDVEILRGFWLGETEVTQAAWWKVMGSWPSGFKGDQLPVESVDWNQASQYCQKVGGRLPTEAEWEYAARGGATAARYGDLDKIAWHLGNSGGRTHPTRSKLPNAFGLYDMLGNVWEWTADWWYGPYDAAATRDPKGPTKGDQRVLRGGSWYVDPVYVRVSGRNGYVPTLRNYNIGFRCAGEFR